MTILDKFNDGKVFTNKEILTLQKDLGAMIAAAKDLGQDYHLAKSCALNTIAVVNNIVSARGLDVIESERA